MDALLRRRAMIAAGGGSPTPPGLVFYDRIVFDGAAYVETDIVPPENASFRLTAGYETIQGAQRVFMNSCANASYSGITITRSENRKRYLNIYYQSASTVKTDFTLEWSELQYAFMLTPKRTGMGTYSIIISGGASIPNGPVLIGTNVAKNGQPFSGRMGRFIIYGPDAQDATDSIDLLNNYTPLYDLRPCTYNGEAGFWCMETSTFYGNTAGAGTLSVMNNS